MKCCLRKRLVKDPEDVGILQPHHIKAGLEIREDDHVLAVCYRGEAVIRYPISGALSKYQIRRDADEWLSRQLNLQPPDRGIGGSFGFVDKD